jgi:hypothetical protein
MTQFFMVELQDGSPKPDCHAMLAEPREQVGLMPFGGQSLQIPFSSIDCHDCNM